MTLFFLVIYGIAQNLFFGAPSVLPPLFSPIQCLPSSGKEKSSHTIDPMCVSAYVALFFESVMT
jgi:hypothetical protein